MRGTAGCLLACTLPWTACGGGGGGDSPPPPGANEARFGIQSIEIPAAQDVAAITVRCEQLPESAGAVLLEGDLDTGPALAPATSRSPLRALLGRPTLDGDMVAGAFHVLYGDARNTQAVPLAAGDLFEIWLQVQPPRSAGAFEVLLRNLRVVDAEGRDVPVATAPARAVVTIR